MLLNLSNHPSANWPPEQRDIAIREYGSISDLPFPNIDPTADEAAIQALAKDYCADIKKRKVKAVHLMGELTFCFALVQLLKKEKINCIASTTHRIAEEKDGKKITVFQFVRFRKY
jgi:hypothetical protein